MRLPVPSLLPFSLESTKEMVQPTAAIREPIADLLEESHLVVSCSHVLADIQASRASHRRLPFASELDDDNAPSQMSFSRHKLRLRGMSALHAAKYMFGAAREPVPSYPLTAGGECVCCIAWSCNETADTNYVEGLLQRAFVDVAQYSAAGYVRLLATRGQHSVSFILTDVAQFLGCAAFHGYERRFGTMCLLGLSHLPYALLVRTLIPAMYGACVAGRADFARRVWAYANARRGPEEPQPIKLLHMRYIKALKMHVTSHALASFVFLWPDEFHDAVFIECIRGGQIAHATALAAGSAHLREKIGSMIPAQADKATLTATRIGTDECLLWSQMTSEETIALDIVRSRLRWAAATIWRAWWLYAYAPTTEANMTRVHRMFNRIHYNRVMQELSDRGRVSSAGMFPFDRDAALAIPNGANSMGREMNWREI